MADTPQKSEDALLKDLAARLRQKNITKSLTSDLDETAGILKSQKGRLAELHELAIINKDDSGSIEKEIEDENKRLEQLEKDLEANDKFKQRINAQVAKSRTLTEQANAKSDDLSQKTATLSAAGKNLNIDNGGALDRIVHALAAGMAKAVTDMRALGLPAKEFAAKTLAVLDKYKDGIATDPALNLEGDENAAKAKTTILDILDQHKASVVAAGELNPIKLLGNALKGGLKQSIADTVKGLPGMATMDKLASVMGLKPVSERINEKLGGKKGSLDQKLIKDRGADVANVQDDATDTIASALGSRTGRDIADESLAGAKPIGNSPVSVRRGRGMSAGSAYSFAEDTAGNLGSNDAIGYLKNIEQVLHELWQLGDDAAKRDIEAAQDANEARGEKNTDAQSRSPIRNTDNEKPNEKTNDKTNEKESDSSNWILRIAKFVEVIGALSVPIAAVSAAMFTLGGIIGGAAFLGFFKSVGGKAFSSSKIYKDAAKINKDAGKEVISSVGGSNAMAPRIKAYEEKIKSGGTKEEAAMAAAAVDKAPAASTPPQQKTSSPEPAPAAAGSSEFTTSSESVRATLSGDADGKLAAMLKGSFDRQPAGGGGGAQPAGAVSAGALKFTSKSGSEQSFQALTPGFKTRVIAAATEYHAKTGKAIQINSAKRDPKDQQRLWDESVKAGRPGRGPGGMAIAKPGRSRHEKGSAVDIQNFKDPIAVAAMNRQGLSQGVPGDPVHFQLGTGSPQENADQAPVAVNASGTGSPSAPSSLGGSLTASNMGASGTGSPTAPSPQPGPAAATRNAAAVSAGASAGAAAPMIVANIGGPPAPAAPSVTMMMPIPIPIRPRTEDMVLRAIQSVNYV